MLFVINKPRFLLRVGGFKKRDLVFFDRSEMSLHSLDDLAVYAFVLYKACVEMLFAVIFFGQDLNEQIRIPPLTTIIS